MLVLSRVTGESIKIGHDIEVKVLGVKGNQVRIGVEAPKEIKVYRDEIYKRIYNQVETEWQEGVPERIQ